LSAGAEQRIDTAPVAQLDAWLDGIFDAASLDDLIRRRRGGLARSGAEGYVVQCVFN
jgi:hypothetical protein